MRLSRTSHPRWGDTLAKQLSAAEFEDPNEMTTQVVTKNRLFWTSTEVKNVPVGPRKAKPHDSVLRTFRHTCALKKLTFRRIDGEPGFVGEFDVLPKGTFHMEDVVFRFDKKQVKKGQPPIAQVRFEGMGPRQGPLKNFNTLSARITFRDHAQAAQHIKLPKGRPVVRYDGGRYTRSSDGFYRSEDDGSLLPWIIVAYLVLSNDARDSLAQGSSELRDAFADI